MRTLWGLAAAALAGVLAAAPAQAETRLDLETAVKTALSRNPALERASWDLEARKRQKDNAWAPLFPSVGLSAGLSRANEVPSPDGGETKPEPKWNYSQGLSVSVTLSGNLFADWQAAQKAYVSGQVSYETARRTLEKTVRRIWYSLLLDRENLKLTGEALGLKAGNLADTEARYKAGLASDLEVLSARVSWESQKPGLLRLQAAYEEELAQFASLLGLGSGRDLVLDGELRGPASPALALEKARGTAGLSPEVWAAEAAWDQARWNAEGRKWASWLPSLTLGWNTAPSLELSPGAKWSDPAGGLSLRLSYALDGLAPWSAPGEAAAQAADQVRSLQSQRDEARTASAQKQQNARRQIETAAAAVQALETVVQLAQKSYDLNREAYRKGAKDLPGLKESEGSLNQARYDLLAQRFALLDNLLTLEYELGVPFGSLAGN